MYNIKLDDNNYYTGSYAKVGRVQGGIDLPSLPPTEDSQKSLFYKWDDYIEYIPSKRIKYKSIEDEFGEPILVEDLDEDGNLQYEDYTIEEPRIGWVFDEDKYKAYLEDQANIIPELTTDEKVSVLQEENELLKGCIMELAEQLFN